MKNRTALHWKQFIHESYSHMKHCPTSACKLAVVFHPSIGELHKNQVQHCNREGTLIPLNNRIKKNLETKNKSHNLRITRIILQNKQDNAKQVIHCMIIGIKMHRCRRLLIMIPD